MKTIRAAAVGLLLALLVACSKESVDPAAALYGTWHSNQDLRIYAFAQDGSVSLSLPTESANPFIPILEWTDAKAYALGDYIAPADPADSGSPQRLLCFACTQAGTSGGAEPAWTSAAPVGDGTVVWSYRSRPSVAGTWTFDGTTLAMTWTASGETETGSVSVSGGMLQFSPSNGEATLILLKG